MTDGAVNAILETNGVVYLGGEFKHVSPNGGRGTLVNIYSGQKVPLLPQANGAILSVIQDGAGGWFIGGQFSSVGGVPLTNIAHLFADLKVDPNWRPNPSGPTNRVFAMLLGSNAVYVAGVFTNISGQTRSGVAALDPVTGAARPWNGAVEGEVYCLAAQGDRLYVGGTFAAVGGRARTHLASVDAQTGNVTDWNPAVTGVDTLSPGINSLVVDQNLLYVGGFFTNLSGFRRDYIAAVDTATGLPTAWNPKADDGVQALALLCNTVYAAGYFSTIGGEARSRIAAIDVATGKATSWAPEADAEIFALAAAGNLIYAGGLFTRIGGESRNSIAALDAGSGRATPWNPTVDRGIFALAISGDRLFAGGGINEGGLERQNLAALDARTGAALAWAPNANGPVYALAAAGSNVYVGGNFTQVGGAARRSVAAVDRTTGRSATWKADAGGFGTNTQIRALAIEGNRIYTGGLFASIGGKARNFIAALNLTTGAAADWDPGADSTVLSLAASDKKIYAGGFFSFIGGQFRNRIAEIDATTAIASAWNPSANDYVDALAVDQLQVYAGGGFTVVGGQPRTGIARIDRGTGAVTPWHPILESVFPFTAVEAIALAGNLVYIGGVFDTVNGQMRQGIALLDTLSGALSDWNPNLGDFRASAFAVAVSGPSVYTGGFILTVGEEARSGIVAFGPVGSPRIITQPISQSVLPGTEVFFQVNAEGIAPLAYQWQFNGTNLAGATNSIYAIASPQLDDSGSYRIVVMNILGQTTSQEAVLTVIEPVLITSQPIGQTVAPGANVTLSVIARGSPPPFFQWRRNGVNISGATASTFTLTNAQPSDGGSFDVVVGNTVSAVKSELAMVIVNSGALPFADNFSNRLTANSRSGIGSGNNTLSTGEFGEPKHAGKTGGKSLWYSWRAPAGGIASFHTRGSGFDTLLAIYTGTSLANLIEVASDDDRGGFLTSELAFNAVAGTEYIIAVDGFGGASGNIVLSWNLDSAASELPRIIRPPLSQTVPAGVDVIFTALVSSPGPVTYQWFYNCAPIPFATNDAVTISNVRPAVVGSYTVRVSNGLSNTVESLPAILEIGADPKARSQDKFQDLFAEPETSPAIEASLQSRPAGFPSVAAGTLGSQTLNNFNATTELGEPLHGGAIGGASRWFKVLAADTGVMQIDTLGSEIDTVLAVYTGTDLLKLTLIASDNNSAPDGLRSVVKFPAKNGTPYLIAVDGVSGGQGHVQLNWKLGIPPAFDQKPGNVEILAGEGVILSASATGIPSAAFQWQRNGIDLPGETNSLLILQNAQEGNQGNYTIVVSNFAGSVRASAVVSVIVRPQLIGSINSSHGFTLQLIGQPARSYIIQGSTNLIEWIPLLTNTLVTGALNFTDSQNSNLPYRFYRSLLLRP